MHVCKCECVPLRVEGLEAAAFTWCDRPFPFDVHERTAGPGCPGGRAGGAQERCAVHDRAHDHRGPREPRGS
eukprot:1417972-Alexandrium_andersonii.AAC.1